jgi:hypothetical protein
MSISYNYAWMHGRVELPLPTIRVLPNINGKLTSKIDWFMNWRNVPDKPGWSLSNG